MLRLILRTACAVLAVIPLAVGAEVSCRQVEYPNKADKVDVPAELCLPSDADGAPRVLFIHARRGYDEAERAHVRELAAQGFVVLAPNWQAGRFLERWPVEHDPATEKDVSLGVDYLKGLAQGRRGRIGIVGYSRGGYYAIRLAAERPKDIGAIVSYAGHMQNPNAPEPHQLYGFAPEINTITTPMLFIVGDQDFELRRINIGRAFYALYERGVPVELQMYPMARRAFDFRDTQTPEEKLAARHARERTREFLMRYVKK